MKNKWDRRDSKHAKKKLPSDNRRSVRWMYLKTIEDSNKAKIKRGGGAMNDIRIVGKMTRNEGLKIRGRIRKLDEVVRLRIENVDGTLRETHFAKGGQDGKVKA